VPGRINGALRQIRIDKGAWLGHDQICLPRLVAIEGFEIGEGDSAKTHRGSVASLIVPDSEMVDLSPANAGDDLENGQARRLQGHGGIKVGTALLNGGEMEASRIGDSLYFISCGQVRCRENDGRVNPAKEEIQEIVRDLATARI